MLEAQCNVAVTAPEKVASQMPHCQLPTADGAGFIDEPLDKTLARMHRQQFGYWWEGFRRGRQAGGAARQMWIDYPFGALLLDESWAWWSLQQVQDDGQWQAEQAGYPEGLVVASSSVEVAVLFWTAGSEAPQLLSVPYLAALDGQTFGVQPHAFLAEQFLKQTGFDDPGRVLACAFVQHRPRRAAQTLVSAATDPSCRSVLQAPPRRALASTLVPASLQCRTAGSNVCVQQVRSDVSKQRHAI